MPVVTVDVENSLIMKGFWDEVSIACPLPAEVVASVEQVPWRLDGSLVRFVAGYSPEDMAEFIEQVANDHYGPRMKEHGSDESWWSWNTVRRVLSQARMNELGLVE